MINTSTVAHQGRWGVHSITVGLTASCGARLSAPSRNGFLGEPHRETAPLTQAGVVLGPIRHPMPLLGNAVPASGIGFERHGRHPT